MNLQPLNICLSYMQTQRCIDKISDNHDIKVQCWSDELKQYIKKSMVTVSSISYNMHIF